MPEGARDGILKGMYVDPAHEQAGREAARPALRQRHDPHRSAQGAEDSRGEVRHRRGRVERHELRESLSRRPRVRSLEPPASGRQAARALCGPDDREGAWRVRRRLRLPEGAAGFDRPLAAAADSDARHRWLRPIRHARRAARLLRGRCALHHARNAVRAAPGQADCSPSSWSMRSAISKSILRSRSGYQLDSLMDFTLPNLGENVEKGDVLRVLVKPGDTIKKDQTVLELETDKATLEVPSSVEGVVKEVKVKPGDKVKARSARRWCVRRQKAGAPAAKDAAEPAAKPRRKQPKPRPAAGKKPPEPAREEPRRRGWCVHAHRRAGGPAGTGAASGKSRASAEWSTSAAANPPQPPRRRPRSPRWRRPAPSHRPRRRCGVWPARLASTSRRCRAPARAAASRKPTSRSSRAAS